MQKLVLIFFVMTLSHSGYAGPLESVLGRDFYEDANEFNLFDLGLGSIHSDLQNQKLGQETPVLKFGEKPYKPVKFWGHAYLGEDYKVMGKYSDLFQGEVRPETVSDLFNEQSIVRMKAGIGGQVQWEEWALRLQPANFRYFSYKVNEAFPQVFIRANLDHVISLRWQPKIHSNLFYQVQTTGIYRTYILQELSLLDGISNPDEYLKREKSYALFFEPLIGYQWKHPLQPRVGVKLNKWGLRQQSEGIDSKPELDVFTDFTPLTIFGDFNFFASYTVKDDYRFETDRIQLSGVYQLGLMSALVRWKELGQAYGVYSSLWNFRVGLLYERTKIELPFYTTQTEDSFFTEISIGM